LAAETICVTFLDNDKALSGNGSLKGDIMTVNPPAIEFDAVSKDYTLRNGESLSALTDFKLRVPVGQVFGFAGPNGAGKSTAIKILVGLLRSTSGRTTVFGHPAGSKESKKLVGFLPEVTLYHEFMTASELLLIHATLAGVKRSQRASRCEETLERVGLAERRKSRIKEFSKGMKQRFGIAQAIVGNPKLLVLDELTSGLDPHAQASLLSLLLSLKQEQGMTIFFSSHHLREIEKICDSVAILHKGRLRCSGSIAEVLGEAEEVLVQAHFLQDGPPATAGTQWRREIDGSYSAVLKTSEVSARLIEIDALDARIVSLSSRRKPLEELFHELTSERESECGAK